MKAPFLIGPTLLGGFFFTTESITCRRPNPWRPTQNRKEYPPLRFLAGVSPVMHDF
jgi:hypothetical protein